MSSSSGIWAEVLDHASVGIALIDSDGALVRLNSFGAKILGLQPGEHPDVDSPFDLVAAHGESLTEWTTPHGEVVKLSYQAGGQVAEMRAISFHDVTDQRRRQDRIASIARTAASMASSSALEPTLAAMAQEIQESDGVAATQIITGQAARGRLQIMGAAGFQHAEHFFELLMDSYDRGAHLVTFEAMNSLKQVVRRNRRSEMLAASSWSPIHEYISQIAWEDFVSTPLVVRGKAVGVLNVYVAPKVVVDGTMLYYFSSMAEQAALAIDYTELIERDRIIVRREERKRLARDLHDSVVQQVFSMSMQARALRTIGSQLPEQHQALVTSIGAELGELARAVQRDLRGIVLALQPSMSAELGLSAAIALLAEGVARRTHIAIDTDIGLAADIHDDHFIEDVYQVISEAIHNAAKHADPAKISVVVRSRADEGIVLEVTDDGNGLLATAGPNAYGLTSMRDRVTRWGGRLIVADVEEGHGVSVRAELPNPTKLRRARG